MLQFKVPISMETEIRFYCSTKEIILKISSEINGTGTVNRLKFVWFKLLIFFLEYVHLIVLKSSSRFSRLGYKHQAV